MKRYFLLFALSHIFYNCDGQLFDRFVLGTSVTYILDSYPLPTNLTRDYTYQEVTTNLNFGIDVYKGIRVGFQNLLINAARSDEKERFNITGGFLQYGFKRKTGSRIYLEGSYNTGNYCTCKDEEPYKRPQLDYYGIGAGYDWKLTNWLHLDLGFFNYNIIDDEPGKYNFTQYVIGLDFQLAK